MIEEIRSKVVSIIEHNRSNEVTSKSNFHNAGVYMLYVDCFDDDKIIPFYIGQTSDFQERHKQHLTKVMALNRLNRECYEYALFEDLYNGQARPCKIFSYMVNHGCSIKNLHMIVLEIVENQEKRIKTEQKYIDELYAPFFGFNQLNSVLRFIDVYHGHGDEKEYCMAKEQDAEQLLNFPMFGYGPYNWFRSCETLYETISIKQLNMKIPVLYLEICNSKKRLQEICLRCAEIRKYNNWEAAEVIWDICKETINEFFLKRKLKSEDKKKLVVKVFLFNLERDRKELEQYFARYSSRINEDLLEKIIRIHGKEIQPIKQRIDDNQREYSLLEKEKESLNNIVFGMLLPKQYKSHPLAAMEQNISFNISGEENICYLNVEFTCFKADYHCNCYPMVSKIDYCVVKNGESKARTVYIDNPLTEFFVREDVYYCESGVRYGPFKPYLKGCIDTHIPVTMEYKNGINEWSLRNKKTEDFREVIKEIDSMIDEKTKVIYSTSGYKSTILRFLETDTLTGTILVKKLKRLCK